jgi:hypothetical protein
MRHGVGACLLALAAAGCAAQPASPACPAPAEVTHEHMFGFWRAEVEGGGGATLLLEKHAVYGESFSGAVNRGGARALVAGDVDDGDFTLEESQDGVRISATWIGEVVEGSCGREIRGTWKAEGDALAKPFVLRKMQGG